MRNGLLIVPVLALLTGCTTYINIPPQPGDLAVHNPNNGTVREVESTGLAAVLAGRSAGQRLGVKLPEGTDAETYKRIITPLGDKVYQDEAVQPKAFAEVRRVAVRGRYAEVDIVMPEPTSQVPQLYTAYLAWEPGRGWYSQRVKHWRIPVGDALEASADSTPETDGG